MNNEANELRKMEIVRERAERMIEQQSILDVVSSLLLRLESGYAFDVEGRVVPSEACATYDGIACRDATIRLQDERIAELRKSISEAVSRADSLAHKLERDAVLLSSETKARIALERDVADYKRLEAICENRSDVVDGDEGRQLPNEAMSILMEWRRPQ